MLVLFSSNSDYEATLVKLFTSDLAIQSSLHRSAFIENQKRLITRMMIFLLASFTAGSALSAAKEFPPFELGINLSSFDYWSSAVPFKDLMFQAGQGMVMKDEQKECPDQPPRDGEGYPLYLPGGCYYRIWSVFHIVSPYWEDTNIKPYRPGRYVLFYEGEGEISIGWDAKNLMGGQGHIEFDVLAPNNGIAITVRTTKKGNHVRNLHLVHIDDVATYKTKPFNERWLRLLRPFKVIRFMDWGRVSLVDIRFDGRAVAHTNRTIVLPPVAPSQDDIFNDMVALVTVNGKNPRVFINDYDGATRTVHLRNSIETSSTPEQPTLQIIGFPNRRWANRASTKTLYQQGPAGVAFEYMIKLANTLDANPWICVPTAADDNFVEQLALLIKRTLKPTLKAYIEYSNETWNYGYPGYHYSEAKVKELEIENTGTWIPADAYQAYRGVEIFRIFNRVFGESDLREQRRNSRIVRVLTSQTAWVERAIRVMDWGNGRQAWPTAGLPAHRFADAWAITTYFGLPEKSKGVDKATTDELIDLQIQNIDELAAAGTDNGFVRRSVEEIKARNLRAVVYEGGTGLLPPADRPDLVEKLVRANRHPRMRDVYAHALRKWEEFTDQYGRDMIGVWSQYYDVGRYSQWGYWGMLESTYQDINTAPKYLAVLDYQARYAANPAPAPKGQRSSRR